MTSPNSWCCSHYLATIPCGWKSRQNWKEMVCSVSRSSFSIYVGQWILDVLISFCRNCWRQVILPCHLLVALSRSFIYLVTWSCNQEKIGFWPGASIHKWEPFQDCDWGGGMGVQVNQSHGTSQFLELIAFWNTVLLMQTILSTPIPDGLRLAHCCTVTSH